MRPSFFVSSLLLVAALGSPSTAQAPTRWSVAATEWRYVDDLLTPARLRRLMRRFTREEGIPEGRLVERFGESPRLVAGVTERSTEIYLHVGRKLAALGPSASAGATAEDVEVQDRPDGRVAVRVRWVWEDRVQHDVSVCTIDASSSDCATITVTTRRGESELPPPSITCRPAAAAIECDGEAQLSRSLAGLFARTPNTGRGVDLLR